MKVREFERLVAGSRNRLFGYAFHFLGNREEAEDVVQDVYMRLWRKRAEVRADGLGWLVSVTRNLCIDRLRRRHVRAVVEVNSEIVDDLASDEKSPEDAAATRVFEALVGEAVQRLPDPQKSIVILREILGMSYNEICDALDLPMTTVKVYLHRGRRHLRRHLTTVINRETA